MISLRDMSLLTQAGWLAVLVVGFVSFLGLVGLRFQRRGSARFWASPAAVGLCLLPAAVGAAFAGLVLRETFAGMALTGAGGVAAIAAGSMEALTPVLIGLAVVLALTACAFLMTVLGSSRTTAGVPSGLAGWALLAGALVTLVLMSGVLALILRLVADLNGVSTHPQELTARLQLSLIGAFALVVLTAAVALVAAFVAPRGASGLGLKLASLATVALCGLLAAAGLWATWTRAQRLMETAMTGVPEGELPEPVQPEVTEVATPPPPPPPPPSAAPGERFTKRGFEPPRGTLPAGPGEAYRVGGNIREPRKVKHVSPVYPDIARQARVQGIVILECTISPRGHVTSVTVLRGIPLLDAAAIEAVRQWVYEPTLLNGVPVPVIMTVTVNYRLAPD